GGSQTPLLPRPLCSLARLAGRLLDVLGYPGAVDVLGISWGGALAQEFALSCPRRVRRLVLASTSTGWLSIPGRPSALWILATPRRYYSPTYFEAVQPTLYGGAVRGDPRLPRQQGPLRFLHPPAGASHLVHLATA